MTRYYRVRNSAYSAFRRANPHSANFTAYGSQYANFGPMNMLKNAYGTVKGAAKGAGQYIASAPGRLGGAIGEGVESLGTNIAARGMQGMANPGLRGSVSQRVMEAGGNLANAGSAVAGSKWGRRALGAGVLGLGTAGVAGAGYAGYRALNPRQAPMEEEMMEDPSMIDQYKQRAMGAYQNARGQAVGAYNNLRNRFGSQEEM